MAAIARPMHLLLRLWWCRLLRRHVLQWTRGLPNSRCGLTTSFPITDITGGVIQITGQHFPSKENPCWLHQFQGRTCHGSMQVPANVMKASWVCSAKLKRSARIQSSAPAGKVWHHLSSFFGDKWWNFLGQLNLWRNHLEKLGQKPCHDWQYCPSRRGLPLLSHGAQNSPCHSISSFLAAQRVSPQFFCPKTSNFPRWFMLPASYFLKKVASGHLADFSACRAVHCQVGQGFSFDLPAGAAGVARCRWWVTRIEILGCPKVFTLWHLRDFYLVISRWSDAWILHLDFILICLSPNLHCSSLQKPRGPGIRRPCTSSSGGSCFAALWWPLKPRQAMRFCWCFKKDPRIEINPFTNNIHNDEF